MDDGAPQVDAVPIPSMLVAMAVAVPALCIPMAVIMAFMIIAMRISRFHILQQQSACTRIPQGYTVALSVYLICYGTKGRPQRSAHR